MRLAILIAGVSLCGAASLAGAQDLSPPALPDKPPAPFKPADTPEVPDTWIFSGVLSGRHEGFSGTLVAGKSNTQFELRLTSGATCDGGDLTGELGFVRLPEITCSDERKMRALFVPQGHETLKVFGHIGEEKFSTEAHLLGTEAPPEPKQTAAPKGPLGLPPTPPGQAPAAPPH